MRAAEALTTIPYFPARTRLGALLMPGTKSATTSLAGRNGAETPLSRLNTLEMMPTLGSVRCAAAVEVETGSKMTRSV